MHAMDEQRSFTVVPQEGKSLLDLFWRGNCIAKGCVIAILEGKHQLRAIIHPQALALVRILAG